MNLATEKFEVGQSVQMTEKALIQRLDGPIAKRSTETVKGFPLRCDYADVRMLVYIRRDGEKYNHTYHIDFWESANEPNFKN